MKTIKKIGAWRSASLAALTLFAAAFFLTTKAEHNQSAVNSDYMTMEDLSAIDRQTWKSLPYQIRIPVYETFSEEKKRTFWKQKHEELKRLGWSPAELEHIDAFYSVICENPLLMEYEGVSEELQDRFEIFRYNWRDYAHENFGWSEMILHAIASSADEVLNLRGELKVYTPIAVGDEVWIATRSVYSECKACEGANYGELIPHPRYCAAFFVCNSGIAYPGWCPSGLIFDNRIKQCNFRESTPCIPTYI